MERKEYYEVNLPPWKGCKEMIDFTNCKTDPFRAYDGANGSNF